MTRGKELLGHIVTKEGTFIDPERVSAIQKLQLPNPEKELQSFFGKIHFLRRSLPDSEEMVFTISMLGRGQGIKWSDEAGF